MRYPRPLDFEGEESVGPLSHSLGIRYPVARKIQATSVVITPTGVSQQPSSEVNWTFQDISEDWKITYPANLCRSKLTNIHHGMISVNDSMRPWKHLPKQCTHLSTIVLA